MKEANQLSPATSSSASSVGEREEFPEDFVKYVRRELNLSQLEDTAWVFWSRRDDYPISLQSDFDLNVIPDSIPKVKDKIRLAIGSIILHPRCGRSLIQYWAGTSIEGRTLLSTQNQPFALGKTRRSTWWLCEYRMKSIECKFYWDIGENGEEELGHPGRVFRHKLPESAPDVQYYSLNGYPQCDDASHYQVVSWVLPVLEHSSQICVGVLELVSAIDTISDWFDKSFRRNLNDVFQELGLQFIDRGIQRWPPCNINRVGSPWPLCVEHDEVISQLTSDMPPNQVSASVAHIKRHDIAYQETKTVLKVFPAVLPNVGDAMQLDLPEEPSLMELDATRMMELDATMIGAQDFKTDNSLPSISHLEKERRITLKDLQQHFGRRREDVANSLGVSISTLNRICRRRGIRQWPYQENGGGAKMLLDSVDQPSMNAVNKGRSFISAEQSNWDITCLGEGTIKMPERERGKTGVRIHISLEDILRYSNMKLDDAASKLNVSSSTLKRLCREYGINRWPPCNLNKVGSPQPSHIEHQDGISQLTSGMPYNQALDSRHHGINRWPPRDLNKVGSPRASHIEHQDGISQLTSDMPSNQVSTGVAHIKPPDTTFQETKMVTIRAKYINGFTIKFQLCIPSRLVELQQEVAKRLNLEDGTYNVVYEDEDNELILVACDEDLQDFIRTSTSLGKKSVVVLLEPKKQLPTDANDICLLTQR